MAFERDLKGRSSVCAGHDKDVFLFLFVLNKEKKMNCSNRGAKILSQFSFIFYFFYVFYVFFL